MRVSVIICTYRRPQHLACVLEHLNAQSYKNMEVIVVDGAGSSGYEASREAAMTMAPDIDVQVIASPKGLTLQRNRGLQIARGELICLFDDDVTFESDFIARIVQIFERPDMQDLGGLSGYDIRNFPINIDRRWRLRRLFRIVPSLRPGDIGRLGSSIPVSFMQPFSGYKQVGYFYGFCMIYRAKAIEGMQFDEVLPTYGGEDRDFSFRIPKKWRLMICGDLHLQHFQTVQSRDSGIQRMYQTGFGAGRTFAKHRASAWDYIDLGYAMACEFLIDMLAFAARPNWDRFARAFARPAGTIAGVRSYRQPGYSNPAHAIR